MRIIVSDFAQAEEKFAECTHVVSFHTEQGYPRVNLPESNRLKLVMEDRYSDPGTYEYRRSETIVDRLLEFAASLPDDARVGFNCRAGISRSTAAALIVAVARLGFDRGTALYEGAVRIAAPNETLVFIADQKLDLDGTLMGFIETSVERLYKKNGLLVPTGLLRMANKTENDLNLDEGLFDEFTDKS